MLPSASPDAVGSKDTSSGATPLSGVGAKAAVGAALAPSTCTVRVVVPVALPSSVTVSVTVKSPAAVNVCDGIAPVAVSPSPNDQSYAAMLPSVSTEALASKATSSGAVPLDGVAVNAAPGGVLPPPPPPATATVCVVVSVAPPSSVTVSVTVKSPAPVNVCVGVAPVAVSPSPNVHA